MASRTDAIPAPRSGGGTPGKREQSPPGFARREVKLAPFLLRFPARAEGAIGGQRFQAVRRPRRGGRSRHPAPRAHGAGAEGYMVEIAADGVEAVLKLGLV